MSYLKIWIALNLAALFFAGCSGSDSPAGVAQSFAEAAYSRDIDALMEMVNIPQDAEPAMQTLARGKIEVMLDQMAASAEAKGGIEDIRSGEPTFNDDQSLATVEVTMSFKDGDASEQIEQVRLIKVDGDWKVNL